MRLMPRTRGGSLWRFLLATVLVITAAAATTAVAGLLQFKQLVQDISLQPALKSAPVTAPKPGAPETLLLIGSDHRATDPSYQDSNTDTMLLVRLNGSSKTINLLSVPRDLEVNIPSGGTSYSAKLNSAYSIGGPNLLLKILKTQVFPGFHVNHIIDINFSGFSELIDKIGCVYTDVDHRYYNDTAQTDYSSIDIQAGYQKLCGHNQSERGALAFVRFRHTDSDIVRNARQQDFLRWAKQGYSLSRLVANRDKLLKIFGAHAQTDKYLQSVDGLIDLFNLVAFSNGDQIKQIPFPAQFSACGGADAQTPCYVTALRNKEAQVYREFMTPTTGAPTSDQAKQSTGTPPVHHAKQTTPGVPAGLTEDPLDGKAQAEALGRSKMPVFYPTLIKSGADYCSSITGNCNEYPNPASEYIGSYPRQYLISADGRKYPSYRMTIDINSALGQFYGIQGTTWRDPPILEKPTQTVNVGGKTLLEYFQGSQLTLVAFKTPHGVYWVSNTLTDAIPNKQLVGIAASMRQYVR